MELTGACEEGHVSSGNTNPAVYLAHKWHLGVLNTRDVTQMRQQLLLVCVTGLMGDTVQPDGGGGGVERLSVREALAEIRVSYVYLSCQAC